MPDEFFVLLILFVAFPWVLLKGILAIRQAKNTSRSGLKASDLREIVEDAVTAATEPLHDRIDTLEGLLMGESPAETTERRGRVAETLLDDELDLPDDAPRRRRRVPA